MKRFLLFFLPIVLTAVFLMPATVQAKKIKCGQFLYYEGEVKEKLPHGQGEMVIKHKGYICFKMQGMFSIDGSVTNATIQFNERYRGGMTFEGKLSYTAINDVLTLNIHEGKFVYYQQGKKGWETVYNPHPLAIPSGSNVPITIGCGENGMYIKSEPFDLETTFYADENISSLVGIEKMKGKITYAITSDEPYNIVSKGSKCEKQTLADGTVVELHKVVFPNGDFYDAISGTFSKTFPDGTISTDKKNYEYDANVAGYTKHTIGGQQKVVIKYSDGNVFTGSLSKIKPEEPINEIDSEFIQNVIYKVKSIAELMATYKYWFGTLAKPKGNTTVYWGGETKEKVIAEDKKAKEDYINYWKNEGKKAEALYNELCKKFGKKYVDAAGSGRIAIGTPEGLLDYMRGVHHHHTQADVYIKEHATHTVGQPWAYDWIYITNGKVSYITTKYSYDEHAW
jgi:hypothetical protein